MGLNDTREINLNGTITMSSSVKLSNWKLSTVSKIEDFEWSESPTILVAGKNVPITYIINPTLSIFKSKMAKKFLAEVIAAMKGPKFFDHSDAMTDHFHVSHYIDINLGRWNKPYVLEK